MNDTAFRENYALQKFFQELSAPLSTYYNCNFLTYRRFYLNGKMIYFINNDKWCEYSFQHQIWASKNAINRIKKAYKEGYYYIWSTKPNKNDPVYLKLHEYNLWKGISIYKRHNECVEAFCFVSDIDIDKITNLYINNKNVLDRFCQYFKNCTNDLINKSSTHSLLCSPVKSFIDDYVDAESISQNFIHATPIKNYFLRVTNKDIPLSIQETRCLFLITQGNSMKGVANILNISVQHNPLRY